MYICGILIALSAVRHTFHDDFDPPIIVNDAGRHASEIDEVETADVLNFCHSVRTVLFGNKILCSPELPDLMETQIVYIDGSSLGSETIFARSFMYNRPAYGSVLGKSRVGEGSED